MLGSFLVTREGEEEDTVKKGSWRAGVWFRLQASCKLVMSGAN